MNSRLYRYCFNVSITFSHNKLIKRGNFTPRDRWLTTSAVVLAATHGEVVKAYCLGKGSPYNNLA